MRYYLLYDEDCTLCLRFQKAVRELDETKRIEPVGFHDPRIPQIVPHMGPQELVNSFHLVFPDGSVKSGSHALPDLLSLLPSLRFVGWILKTVPGTQKFSDLIYLWISKTSHPAAPHSPRHPSATPPLRPPSILPPPRHPEAPQGPKDLS